MAITHVNSAAAASTTITIPAHQAGDLILISAFRANNTPATVPGTFTSLQSGGANTLGLSTGFVIATGSGTASGTWTNATQLVCSVFRSDLAGGTLSTSAAQSSTANGNNVANITYPALTLDAGTYSDRALYRVGARGTGVAAVATPPTNYTLGASSPATPVVANFRRLGVTADATADTVAMGANAAVRAHTVEIVEISPVVDQTVGGPALLETGSTLFSPSVTTTVTAVGTLLTAPATVLTPTNVMMAVDVTVVAPHIYT